MDKLLSSLKVVRLFFLLAWTVLFAIAFITNITFNEHGHYIYVLCILGIVVPWTIYILDRNKERMHKKMICLNFGLGILGLILFVVSICFNFIGIHVEQLHYVATAIASTFLLSLAIAWKPKSSQLIINE